ncbi:signal peptidase I [Candidatus Aalborgicola defluviihabitans]|uniref:signal peptidase I n=1 Tax=Candidatus Aalborgicola defluviihabitans TaxID=3386187 RepID=UPI001D45F0FB|nr:signal peptidase I [Burkholderiales bacterium]
MKAFFKDNRGFIAFLVCFGFFRLAIADWNPIPSGSMRPTLLEGDVVLVDRLAYDFKLPLTDTVLFSTGTPQRGDVVTFNSPTDGTRLIKRMVAVPGDVVELHDGLLTVNGERASYDSVHSHQEPLDNGASTRALQATEHLAGSTRTVQFLPDVMARRNWGPVVVPGDQYFFLGDNRDNSADSRYIGLVPRHLLIGRAHHIVVSAAIKEDWQPRMERTAQRIQ